MVGLSFRYTCLSDDAHSLRLYGISLELDEVAQNVAQSGPTPRDVLDFLDDRDYYTTEVREALDGTTANVKWGRSKSAATKPKAATPPTADVAA